METVQHTTWRQRLQAYYYLCRFDKPIGTELVFWPTMWALWIASKGIPDLKILLVMTLGVIFMRAAGFLNQVFALLRYRPWELTMRMQHPKIPEVNGYSAS